MECEKRCKIASTTITEPSTIKPKSIAPSDIKLPPTPNLFIKIIANSIESGITDDTIKPARRLPRKNTSTKITISAPSIKLVSTVLMALSTILVRSRKGSITTPSGSISCILAILSFTRFTTTDEFSPLSIITTAPATSPWSL
ncbi:hypothetical protein D3C85_1070130 [compost metagenome]